MIPTTFEGENLYANSTALERETRKQEIMAIMQAFAYFRGRSDQFRHEDSSSSGGFWLLDENQTAINRSAISEILSVSLQILGCELIIFDCTRLLGGKSSLET